MRRKFFSLCLFVLMTPWASGQKFTVNVKMGVGTYALDGLKQYSQLSLSQLPVELKSIDNFPSSWFYDFQVSRTLGEKWFAGIAFRILSTGSHYHYEDYSGEVVEKQLVKANAAGLLVGYTLWKTERVAVNVRVEGYYSLIRYTLLERLAIGSVVNQTEYSDDLTGVSISPGLEAVYRVNSFSANIFCGYNLDLTTPRMRPSYVMLYSPEIDLSGIRVGIGLGYSF